MENTVFDTDQRSNTSKFLFSTWRGALPPWILCPLKTSLLSYFISASNPVFCQSAVGVLKRLDFLHMVLGIKRFLSHLKSTTKGENYSALAGLRLQMYSHAPRIVLSAWVSSFCLPWSEAEKGLLLHQPWCRTNKRLWGEFCVENLNPTKWTIKQQQHKITLTSLIGAHSLIMRLNFR